MIMMLFYLIVYILFVGFGYYILQLALANLPIEQPFKQLVLALFLLICLLVLAMFVFGGIQLPRMRMMY